MLVVGTVLLLFASTGSLYIASPHAEAEAREPDRLLSGVLDLPRPYGTEPLHAEGRRRCVQPLRYEESLGQSAEDVAPGGHRALGDHRLLHAGRYDRSCSAPGLQNCARPLGEVPIRGDAREGAPIFGRHG